MKKTNVLAAAVAMAALFSATMISCASTNAAAQVKKSSRVERELIDWKGAGIGAEIPSWAESIINDDVKALSKLPQFEGKVIFFAENQGKNKKALKSWTDNFDAGSQFSKRLSSFVTEKFGGELKGSVDEMGEEETYLEEIASVFSRTQFNGLGKELDYWVQVRYVDHDKKTSNDIYQYFVAYAMDKELYKEQLDIAMGKVEARTAAQKESQENVRNAMHENQVWATKTSEEYEE